MPFLGGAYGGYIGMTGSWSYWLGCKGGFIAFSSTNAAQAHSNYVTYHTGVGDGRRTGSWAGKAWTRS